MAPRFHPAAESGVTLMVTPLCVSIISCAEEEYVGGGVTCPGLPKMIKGAAYFLFFPASRATQHTAP